MSIEQTDAGSGSASASKISTRDADPAGKFHLPGGKHRRRQFQKQCIEPSAPNSSRSRPQVWLELLGITEDHIQAHILALSASKLRPTKHPSGTESDLATEMKSSSIPVDKDGWQVADDDLFQDEASHGRSTSKNDRNGGSEKGGDEWKVVKSKRSKRRKDVRAGPAASEKPSPDGDGDRDGNDASASGESLPLSSQVSMSPNPDIDSGPPTGQDSNGQQTESQESLRQYPNLSSRDMEQVAKDVERSFIGPAFRSFFPANPDDDAVDDTSATPQQKALRREQLSHLILTTLSRHPSLCYFQGYHDILTVLLLTLSPDAPSTTHLFPSLRTQSILELCAERISLFLIRDSMTRDLLPIMGQLKLLSNLVRSADPGFAQLVDRASPLPFFALPWLLTLLTHDAEDVAVMQRVIEFVLAYGPVSAVYLCASVVVRGKKGEVEELGEEVAEDPAMLHAVLGRLPTIVADEEAEVQQPDLEGGERDASKKQVDEGKASGSPDSTAIYTDPDVELPSLASDRALAAGSDDPATAAEKQTTRQGIPISILLQEAVQLMEKYPLSSDALQARAIMGPKSVLFTWSETFDPRTTSTTPNDTHSSPDDDVDWQQATDLAISALTGPTEDIVQDPHPPASIDDDFSVSDEKPHIVDEKRRRWHLTDSTKAAHPATQMLAVVGISGLLVAALFSAGAGQSQARIGTEETKRVLTLIVSLLSGWGRVVGGSG
ncbi:GTPase-activating protein GYP8 [Pseudozyma hubeiensis]|nr:GTPase-activating protein GYP8 [Pseudozyma hubeiensis]